MWTARILTLVITTATLNAYDPQTSTSEESFDYRGCTVYSELCATRRTNLVESSSRKMRFPGTQFRITNEEKYVETVVYIHGAKIYSSIITHLKIDKKHSFQIISNDESDSEFRAFQPATSVLLASCLWPRDHFPRDNGPHVYDKRRRKIKLLNCSKSTEMSNRLSRPCLFAQDYFLPGLFQHALINSVPTLGIASLVKRALFPDAVLVGLDDRQDYVTGEHSGRQTERWEFWRNTSSCGLVNNTPLREWLFIGSGGTAHATNDCYPVGSFDWYRRDIASSRSGHLLVYASRESQNGSGSRIARREDSRALELWLSATLAPELRLRYVKVDPSNSSYVLRSSFYHARVIFAPHGGALSNLIFSHESTLVIEFLPSRGKRLCYACMAYAMRFPSYAIYIPRGPGGWNEDINTKVPYKLNVSDLQYLWYNKVKFFLKRSST